MLSASYAITAFADFNHPFKAEVMQLFSIKHKCTYTSNVETEGSILNSGLKKYNSFVCMCNLNSLDTFPVRPKTFLNLLKTSLNINVVVLLILDVFCYKWRDLVVLPQHYFTVNFGSSLHFPPCMCTYCEIFGILVIWTYSRKIDPQLNE